MFQRTMKSDAVIGVSIHQRVEAPTLPALPWVFAVWMAVASALAVVAGLVLGILAATELSVGGTRWTPSVQAHGRLQVFGLVATFVVALALEFLVRLNGRPAFSLRTRAGLPALLAAGAVLLAAGQLWYDRVEFLAYGGSAVFLAGTAIFAAVTWRIPLQRPANIDPQPLFMRAAAGWLVVAAALSGWGVLETEFGVIPLDISFSTVEVFLRGFVTLAIIGVSLRAITGHLSLRPVTADRQLLVFIVLNASIAAWLLAAGLGPLPPIGWVERIADAAFAGGLLAFTWFLGVVPALWRPGRAPRYARLVPLAWAGAVSYCLLLLVTAALPGGRNIGLYEEGAIRHTYLLGFVLPLMVAMTHIVLARFTIGFVPWENALTAAFFMLIAAWPLRTVPFFFQTSPSQGSRWLLSTAGFLAMAALLLVAAVCLRSAHLMARRMRRAPIPRAVVIP